MWGYMTLSLVSPVKRVSSWVFYKEYLALQFISRAKFVYNASQQHITSVQHTMLVVWCTMCCIHDLAQVLSFGGHHLEDRVLNSAKSDMLFNVLTHKELDHILEWIFHFDIPDVNGTTEHVLWGYKIVVLVSLAHCVCSWLFAGRYPRVSGLYM